ncbi:hypothetical protein [Actinomadura sp. KC216]|uniref:hypothetical protein n=1 Tax=Actinomadura sp. KC216 TaxID=2530370 RepID=UPI001405298D|nr:hypothetical protein [Actinomadura sp. KC216]
MAKHNDCRNSNESPTSAERRGACGDCAGRRELITNFGGQHNHVTCRTCGGTGRK